MNPTFDDELEQYRATAREFLTGLLPDGWRGSGQLPEDEYRRFNLDLRRRLHEGGYLAVEWPIQYGGQGLSPAHQVVLAEELTAAGLPNGTENDVFSLQMFGNTVLHWGTEEQKQFYLPRILDGTLVFCQGYSEPGSGSDLGSLRTAAVLDGDTWRINGQKIWTSEAHHANWIFVLVRTDPSAPKHKGITLLACPLDQPGIEIRPIRQIHGNSGFNEVFFNDATTDSFHTIGPVNEGWRVAMSLLEFERGGAAAVFAARFEEELDRLVALAADNGKLGDAEVRRTLAWLKGRITAMRMLGYRALTRSLDGKAPGPESAMTKLYWTECHNVAMELSLRILGAQALAPEGRMPTIVDGPDAPDATQDPGTWVGAYLASRASTIYAGTNQIQRNILAERVLGMPR